jgi:hypothetical protein
VGYDKTELTIPGVTFSARGFDELFGRNIEAFFAHGDHFTDTIWATRLESLAKPGGKLGTSRKYIFMRQQILNSSRCLSRLGERVPHSSR